MARLLVKAIRTLPEREQDFLLENLIASGLSGTGIGRRIALEMVSAPELSEISRTTLLKIGETAAAGAAKEITIAGAVIAGLAQMVPVRFSQDQHQRLKAWCEQHGFSMAVVVRGLVEKFLDDQERRAS